MLYEVITATPILHGPKGITEVVEAGRQHPLALTQLRPGKLERLQSGNRLFVSFYRLRTRADFTGYPSYNFV